MSGLLDGLSEAIGQILLVGFVAGVVFSLPAFGLGFVLGRRSAARDDDPKDGALG